MSRTIGAKRHELVKVKAGGEHAALSPDEHDADRVILVELTHNGSEVGTNLN